MKKIFIILINTFVLFIFINLLIVITWPVYSKIKSNKHNYISEQIDLLGLNNKDLITLHNETWKNYDKFRFVPFFGHSETFRKGKFVNFTEENGRKINRPDNCNTSIYLYGGSTTFGYNVTDKQTIGSNLQKLVSNDTCVYNHGRAYFYSKQENNLFYSHLENKKKIDYAIFLDGINERCGGYEYQNYINNSFSLLVEKPYLMWKKSLSNFFYTLPILQFTNSISGNDRWIQDNENNILNIDSCNNKIPLSDLFESRVNNRNAICDFYQIKCLSFLQPMPGTHGNQINKFISDNNLSDIIKKYKELSKAKSPINIGYVLDGDKSLSYIDAVHYSPKSNEKIAMEINNYLK